MENHNNAIRQISPESKYCKLLHSDDLLFPDCIMEMAKLAECHPTVGVVGSYRIHGDRVSKGLPYPASFMSGRELCRLCIFGSEDILGPPSGTLLRSDLVRNQPFYNEVNIASDKESIYKVLQTTDFGFIHKILTYYRVHEEQSQTRLYAKVNFRLNKMFTLKSCGLSFLSEEEYETVSRRVWNDYYGFLARNIFHCKNKQFRECNKKVLESLDESLDFRKLLRAVCQRIFNLFLCPKKGINLATSIFLKKSTIRT